jgi:hypothetical protein
MEVCGQLHAPATLPPEEELPVPSRQENGGFQNRYGRGGKEKKYFLCPCRELNPDLAAHNHEE